MSSTSEPTPTQVRLFALVGLLAEVGLLAWQTRDEWGMAVPALLLIHAVGLLGFWLYRLVVRRWRTELTHEELFSSSGLFTATVVGSVTYLGGEWMGLRSGFGSLAGGIVVGITLVLARLAIWGPISPGTPTQDRKD